MHFFPGLSIFEKELNKRNKKRRGKYTSLKYISSVADLAAFEAFTSSKDLCSKTQH